MVRLSEYEFTVYRGTVKPYHNLAQCLAIDSITAHILE